MSIEHEWRLIWCLNIIFGDLYPLKHRKYQISWKVNFWNFNTKNAISRNWEELWIYKLGVLMYSRVEANARFTARQLFSMLRYSFFKIEYSVIFWDLLCALCAAFFNRSYLALKRLFDAYDSSSKSYNLHRAWITSHLVCKHYFSSTFILLNTEEIIMRPKTEVLDFFY